MVCLPFIHRVGLFFSVYFSILFTGKSRKIMEIFYLIQDTLFYTLIFFILFFFFFFFSILSDMHGTLGLIESQKCILQKKPLLPLGDVGLLSQSQVCPTIRCVTSNNSLLQALSSNSLSSLQGLNSLT